MGITRRLCIFSDWHGEWYELPEADVYVCCGDMYDNYPTLRDYRIDYSREVFNQGKFADKFDARQYFGSPKAPVVVCRGNHDFISLGRIFGKGGDVYEVNTKATHFTVAGIRFGGFRGINKINPPHRSCWCDEEDDAELKRRAMQLDPTLDVLVTHAPPAGVLDLTHSRERVGIAALAAYATARFYTEGPPLRLHCFGHIHEQFGTVSGNQPTGMLFANAARGHIVVDLSEDEIMPVLVKKAL